MIRASFLLRRILVASTLVAGVACETSSQAPRCTRSFLLDGLPATEVTRHQVGAEDRPSVRLTDAPTQFTTRCGGRLRFAVSAEEGAPPVRLHVALRAPGSEIPEPALQLDVAGYDRWQSASADQTLEPGTEISFSLEADGCHFSRG